MRIVGFSYWPLVWPNGIAHCRSLGSRPMALLPCARMPYLREVHRHTLASIVTARRRYKSLTDSEWLLVTTATLEPLTSTTRSPLRRPAPRPTGRPANPTHRDLRPTRWAGGEAEGHRQKGPSARLHHSARVPRAGTGVCVTNWLHVPCFKGTRPQSPNQHRRITGAD